MKSKEISSCFSVDSGNHTWEYNEVESISPKTLKNHQNTLAETVKTNKSFENNLDMNKSLTKNKISENKNFPVPKRSITPALNQTKVYKNQENLLAINEKKLTHFQHRLRPVTSYNNKNNLNAIEMPTSRLKSRRSTLYDSLYINLLSSNLNQSVYSRSKRRHSNIFPVVSQSLNVSKGNSSTFEITERPKTSRKSNPFSPYNKEIKFTADNKLIKSESTKVLNQALKPADKTSFKPSLLKPIDRLSKISFPNKPTSLVKRNGYASNTLFRASPDSLPSRNLQRRNAKTPSKLLRRASMPVVLKKEKFVQVRTTAASSNKQKMQHFKREMMQPNKIDQRKTEGRNPNTERFKTIPETPDDQEIPQNETKPGVKSLTRENLKGVEEFEEERFTTERILEWLETAATGDEALQQVHHDLGDFPEFAQANAIVVVYNEDLKS